MGVWRQHGFAGWQPLEPVNVEAWCRMAGVALGSWELDALGRMEGERLRRPDKSNFGAVVSPTDTAGVRALIGRLGRVRRNPPKPKKRSS